MGISEEHIRYATGQQLASLLGVFPQSVSAWTSGRRHVSGRVFERAEVRGIPKDVLLRGLDLRREEARKARRFRDELNSILGEEI